jgi:hypothetical protein
MNLDEFNAEYGKVLERIKQGKCTTEQAAAEYGRLTDLTAGIDDAVERQVVDRDLATLRDMVNIGRSNDEPEDIWNLVSEALRRANSSSGTITERITRAEDAVAEIKELAAKAPDYLQDALLSSTDTVNLLITSLRAEAAAQPAPAE